MIQLILVSSSSDAEAETLSSPKKKKSRVYLGMFFGLIVDLSIFLCLHCLQCFHRFSCL